DSAFAAGLVLAATAYIAYYYVVYLLFFAIVYLVAWADPIAVTPAASQMTQFQRRLRAACAIAALALVALAAGILLTGGRSFWVFDVAVSARTPQNTLTIAWIFAVAARARTWRPTIRANREAATAWSRAFAVAWRVVAAFAAGAAPLLWQAARLVVHREYVTPEYGWRSVPHGIDLLAPLAGHPRHPLFGAASRRAYDALGQNYIEVIAWLGVVPMVLLAVTRLTARAANNAGQSSSATWAGSAVEGEMRIWRIVGVAFLVWALGPFLVVGGFDTGL